ncbi:hypothetical protein [Xenorhabdus doucetiae]|uniref:Phosphatidylinositol diacylglycerol-lyase n=1 Tax=Xenorhabdus doucetiae TaxID=351671 RepID=A0A068QMH4_9GAMM|nr:hypothetical protein [Xenorhabdus doucetiae]TYP07517.1 hypothetical protein LY16_01752 [Xenorhabdus doucetiae]CDG15814.1 conserved protein of unknown function [Xenorhabdus doucetiae]
MFQIADFMPVNGTNFVWKKISESSHGVDTSVFPDLINPHENRRFYIFGSHEDNMVNCYFDVEYQIMDSENSRFKILGRYQLGPGRLGLELDLVNIDTLNHRKGNIISLGSKPKELTCLFLIGDADYYIGPDINAGSWIRDHLPLLGDHSLKEICIPGSHDAGMSVVTWKTLLAAECNTLTQTNNILGQLNLGIRYFDIRPALSDGKFFTEHFSKVIIWEGALGESMESIINGINKFTEYNNELIMIKLSHSLNLDVGFFETYRPFNKDQWFDLFDQLSTINYLYYHNGVGNVSDSTINTLTANGTRPAVLFFVDKEKEPDVDLGEYEDAGFFYLSELNMYSQFSNSDDYIYMIHDQIQKMRDHAPKQYFEIEWTLTQQFTEVSSCSTGIGFSIRELADMANNILVEVLHPAITKTEYPNIILIDNVKDTTAALLALAINWKVFE